MSNANPGDLFDRWLAHHEHSDDESKATQPPAPPPPTSPPTSTSTTPSAPQPPASGAEEVAIPDTRASREAARALLDQAASQEAPPHQDTSQDAPPHHAAAQEVPLREAAEPPPATPEPAPYVGTRIRREDPPEPEVAEVIDFTATVRAGRRTPLQGDAETAEAVADPATAAPPPPAYRYDPLPERTAEPVREQPLMAPPRVPVTPARERAARETPAEAPAATQNAPATAARAPLPVLPVAETSDGVPAVVEFKPNTSARQRADLGLAGAGAGALLFAVLAVVTHQTWAIGAAAMLGAFGAVLVLTRASSHPVRLIVKRGQLEVERSNGWRKYDLRTSQVNVTATPGDPRWKVDVVGEDASHFAIDASIVDGEEFMRVLRHYRPDL